MRVYGGATESFGDPLTFDDRIDNVRRYVAQHFHLAARPPDLDFGHFGFRPQTEVQARIVL